MATAAVAEEKPVLRVTSDSFRHGSLIPQRFTCDGADISPHIAWSGIPPRAKTLVLSVDDPDAPRGLWNHWYVYNIPPASEQLTEGASGTGLLPAEAVEVANDFERQRYGGPCPPSGQHRYTFTVRALDVSLPGDLLSRAEVESRIASHIIAQGQLLGLYGPRVQKRRAAASQNPP